MLKCIKNKALKIIYSGIIAGFICEEVLVVLFMFSPVQKNLYTPNWQIKLFIEVIPQEIFFHLLMVY